MKTTCPRCSQSISIDPETLASLQGSSHFECPACAGAVAVPLAQASQQIAPLRIPEAEATSLLEPLADTGGATPLATYQGMNRNLLILGSVALLVLGGLAAFVVSRKDGNVHNTTQNIRNEIINNSYFQNLIASGQTTAKDLENIEEAHPYKTGFIGMSRSKLTWSEAQALAAKTASSILNIDEKVDKVPEDLHRVFQDQMSEIAGTTSWISRNNTPGLIDSPDLMKASTPETRRKVIVQWPREEETRNPDASPENDFRYQKGIASVTITGYAGKGGDVVIPNRIEGLPVTAIADRSFENNQAITGIFIPSTVAHIGGSAFQRCINATSLTLSEGVRFIGDSAFRDCRGLRSLTIPRSVDLIRWNGFQNCIGLKTLTFSDGIRILENSSFQGCSGLASVTIPSSVSHIGWNAFRDCTGLKSLFLEGDAPSMGGAAFANASRGFEVRHIPGALGFTPTTWHGWPVRAWDGKRNSP